jgi:hypothetical protein
LVMAFDSVSQAGFRESSDAEPSDPERHTGALARSASEVRPRNPTPQAAFLHDVKGWDHVQAQLDIQSAR